MKKTTKALLMAVCAIALVVASVMGTLAYLTAQDEVTNTFTAGQVKMTMDETDTDVYGVKDSEARVKANDYILIPAHEYVKDPIVHVDPVSEDSYVYVKIENNIAAVIDGGAAAITDQIIANGWNALPDVANVYYQTYDKGAADADLEVFEGFTVQSALDNDDLDDYEGETIVVTAYAIQKDGFDTAKLAWDALRAQITAL